MTVSSTSLIKKIVLLFLAISGLYIAKVFLMPLAIGAVLATLFLPFCKWMESHKIPSVISVFVCMLVLIAAIVLIAGLLGWQLAALNKDITLIKQKLIETAEGMQQYVFSNFGVSRVQQVQIIKDQQDVITGIIAVLAGSVLYVVSNFVLMLVYVFLLLYYRTHLKKFMLQLSSVNQQMEMEQIIYRATNVSQQYLVGLAKMIVCLWIMYSIGFGIWGVKNFIFFAILCGLLEIIPFIGNITGTTITILVALVNGADLSLVGGIALTYGAVQLIQGWVLEPLILGPQVKINPLFTIVALVLGEIVWGIPGIILAIPLTAIFKIVCDHIESLKPYGFLIGEIQSQKKPPQFIEKLKTRFR